MEAIYHEEGRAVPDGSGGFDYQYVLRDHLGNTRVMFADADSDGVIVESEILSEAHYYPFGEEMLGIWNNTATPALNYLYNNKELDSDYGLKLYYYGFRMYDALQGRFTGVDPISDQFPWVSTFNYAENSPIANIDLHGLQKYRPKMESINSPSDLFSIKMLNNLKEGVKTAGVEFGVTLDKGLDYVGEKVGKVLENTMPDEGNPTAKEFYDTGTSHDGSGIEILSSDTKNSNGTMSLDNAAQGSTTIIETGELVIPSDGGGIVSDAAPASTQVAKSMFYGGLMIDKVNSAVDRLQSTGFEQKKVCTFCGDTIDIDAPKNYHTRFDTIKVNEQ